MIEIRNEIFVLKKIILAIKILIDFTILQLCYPKLCSKN
jgi:hypothetical protein